jgi:amino acid adenylation domain-containing protein
MGDNARTDRPVPAPGTTDNQMASRARERLQGMGRRRRNVGAPDAIPRRCQADGPIPMSSAQEGMWFLDQVTGPSPVYTIARAVRLRGPLDIPALGQALRTLVARHESLRTGFEPDDGGPAQRVWPAADVVERVVLTVDDGSDDEAAAGWLTARARVPFDLAQPPLVRLHLLRRTADVHTLLLLVHHIVADGWSLDVLARELGACYAAARHGQRAVLDPLPLQFGDYSCWEQQQLAAPAAGRDLDYWRRQLSGLEPLALPTDRPRPHNGSQAGAEERFTIAPAFLDELKALARREDVTLFMLLVAAFQVVLMRYSGQRDIAVGSPVAGRVRSELEGLIGNFVSSLVLRTDLSGNPTFVELLGRVKQVCLDAYAHQELPFNRLVAEISPERDLSRHPLYQVSFALQNVPASPLALAGLESEPVPCHPGTAKFDLALTLTETAGALTGVVEFATALFDAATVARLARHYLQLLHAIAARPAAPLAALPLLAPEERTELLVTWNATARPYPRLPLAQLFEAQAARTPDALAVVLDADTLTYAELEARANRLAHHLRALGVGPDVLVGLCLHRGPALVVGLLAILKAGGAYLPLDPHYPRERLAFMLADAAAPVVLTEPALRALLPDTQAAVLYADDRPFAHLPATPPAPLATPAHLAYVIYTSGSTGTPKGVAVSQRGVVRLVMNTDYVRLGPSDCVAQASNISFDAATFEIWGALLTGARLAIVPKEALLSHPALIRTIERQRITTMFMTTALFNEYAARAPHAFERLDCLLVGGEAADPIAVQRVIDTAPPKRLVNAYGPTETTTFAVCHEVPQRPGASPASSIPIGRPIANTTCYVLDDALEPVPVGVVGELFIGGPGVARGYLNRPDLTAARFIDDPFNAGERLYRTGDFVRRHADGTLDYVGRIDGQVKLRGFRIELGEIEAALAREPGVSQCAAVVREDASGDRRLVAYVVGSGPSAGLEPTQLCRRLAAQVPPYMVPSAIMVLDSLPLSANGKLDRRALPKPVVGSGTGTEAADDVERTLQGLWEAVLGTRGIGLDDSFFDLGGHSLLAIKLLDRVDKEFGRAFGLAALFEAPTIRAQASLVRRPQAQPPTTCAVAVQPQGGRPPLFFVSGFGGQLLPFRALARELGPDQPLYVLDFNSLRAVDPDRTTIEAVAGEMLGDLRAVQPHGPYHLAGYSLGGKVVYEIAQQLRNAGEDVALLALLDCSAPGYPRRRAFPVRAMLHVRHALTMDPHQRRAYVIERVKRLKKYFGVRGEPKVFKETDQFERTALACAIEARAQPIYRAWLAYAPRPYGGRMTLVRAAVRDYLPGVVDDDVLMGWKPFIAQGVDLATLECGHDEMVDVRHARSLAALLGARLSGSSRQARRVQATGRHG